MAALAKDVKVLVVGAGAMGAGIAQVALRAGHLVYLYDARGEAVERGRSGIERDLRALVAKGRLGEAEAASAIGRLVPLTTLAVARDAGLAIEAVVEDLAVKQDLFRELETLLPQSAILASNTSSLSITALAAPLAHPQRVVGMHFFNPAPRMALVEVVSGLTTDPEVAAQVHATARAWGKTPVHARSTPGFIVNRVARPYYAEALRVLAERAAQPATLDAVLREACGFPMGPFELMDLIGHDVNFAVTRSVFDAYSGDRRFAPSLIQQELVAAGRLGRKSGHGFYRYAEEAERPHAQAEPAQSPAGATVTVIGDLGVAAPLIGRIEAAGIEVRREEGAGAPGWLAIGGARLALSDGRTATRRAVEEGTPNLVLFDLCLDYATTPRIALARADGCGRGAYGAAVAILQRAGLTVTRIDDVAGLIGLRTVAMLANEAADALLTGVASAEDVDAAMRHGTNYPRGPLAWADRLGPAVVAAALANLREHYGEERYRTSPLITRKTWNGERFHE